MSKSFGALLAALFLVKMNRLVTVFALLALLLAGGSASGVRSQAPPRGGPVRPAPTPLVELQLHERRVSPPESRLEGPSIDSFTATAPDCMAPDPARAILSYHVSPGRGGAKIRRVRINALHADDSIRVIYEESAPLGKPWVEASDSGIRDPAPTVETVAYVLAVWDAKGAAVSRRLRFGYTLPLSFRFLDYTSGRFTVGEGRRSDGTDPYFARFNGENVGPITVAVGSSSLPVDIEITYRRAAEVGGLIWISPPPSGRYPRDRDVSFRFTVSGQGDARCRQQITQEAVMPRLTAPSGSGGSGSGGSGSGSGSGGAFHPPMEVCSGAPVPSGYIKVDDKWEGTSCGSPSSITTYNVWVLYYYADHPVGWEMEVCSDAPTPRGWVDAGRSWNGTKCGHPTRDVDNVKTIRRER